MFGLLHHDALCESSHNVMERVDYVRKNKPWNEIAVRLHNMIYLGGCESVTKRALLYADYKTKRALLDADYKTKRGALYADYKTKRALLHADYEARRVPLYADYEAKRVPLDAEILAYIQANIPDCAWNGKELEFTI